MFRLEIRTENDAFGNGGAWYEVARILREVADGAEDRSAGTSASGTLRDGNGASVGEWHYTPDGSNNADRVYVATINIPGYLPMDDDPPTFEHARDAWSYLADERERSEDDTDGEDYYSETVQTLREIVDALDAQSADAIHATGIEDDGTGTVHGGTPGYEGQHDLGLAYCVSWTER